MNLLIRPALPRLPGVLVVAAAAFFFIAVACGSDASAEYPIVLSDSLVDDGRVIYAANCAACHGDSTTPPPLPGAPSHTVEGHTWHHQDRLLVELILDGVTLAQVMPTFRDTLSEDEARAAIAYIKTFWPDDVVEEQIELSAEYERQLAAEPSKR